MSFDSPKGGTHSQTGPSLNIPGRAVEETATELISLLGMYRLNFNLQKNIHNERVKNLLNSGKYSLNNFEENGYGCICYDRGRGTGYALVSSQYLLQRGNKQGVSVYQNSEIVGTTTYKNGDGNNCQTAIYLVGVSVNQPGLGACALNDEDITMSCEELMEKQR